MIKTLLIEDEKAAADRMIRLLKETDKDIHILENTDSISSSIKWLKENPSPDLIILDIQLADGLSFEIFKEVAIESFVIFTTAYDEYAIKAFELNSIDYLLKPIRKDKLQKSISKYRRLRHNHKKIDINDILVSIENRTNFKKRFLVNAGTKLKSINVEEVAYFYSAEKSTFLCTKEDRHYPLELSLDSLEKMVNPELFYRINRQFLVKLEAMIKIHILSKSRIKVELSPVQKEDVFVAKSRTHEFREWLGA